jgi:hypothetical protein
MSGIRSSERAHRINLSGASERCQKSSDHLVRSHRWAHPCSGAAMSAPQQQQRATRLMARLVAKPQLRPKPKRPRRPSRTNAATVVLQWQNKRCTVCNRQNPWQNVGGASTVERAAAALTLVSCGVERVESCVVRVERRSVRHLSPCGASRWGHPRHRSVYRGDKPWCETQT